MSTMKHDQLPKPTLSPEAKDTLDRHFHAPICADARNSYVALVTIIAEPKMHGLLADPDFQHIPTYYDYFTSSKISPAEVAYIRQRSDPALVERFDTLVEEFNRLLPLFVNDTTNTTLQTQLIGISRQLDALFQG